MLSSLLEVLPAGLRVRGVPNQYSYMPEPWIVFGFGSATVTAGRRKRVWSIEVKFEKPVNVQSIKALADRDETTYTADGKWRSDATIASCVVIHAWTEIALAEYMRAVLAVALPSSAGWR